MSDKPTSKWPKKDYFERELLTMIRLLLSGCRRCPPIICWLVLLLAGGLQTNAQMKTGLDKDSLRRLLLMTPDDSLKVNRLIYLGQQYENQQPDSAIRYYQEAGSLSRRLQYPAGFIRYVSNYTAVLNLRGKYKESLQLNLQAIDTCQKYQLDVTSYLRAYINTGNVYELLSDYTSAAVYYLKALPLAEANSDAQRLSTLYNSLSGLYRSLNQPVKALDYGQRSLAMAEKEKDLYSSGLACINIGNTLNDLGRIEEGISYIKRAYVISSRLNDSALKETALIDLGDSYLKRNKPDQYIPLYRQALILSRALGDLSGQAYAMQGLAYGYFWTARYTGAETLLNQAIPFARQNDQKEVWRNLLLLMSDVQAILGHMDPYRRFRAAADSVSDAMMNNSLLKNIQELETKYAVEKQQHDLLKKDLLLAEKDKTAARQRTWLIAALAGALLLASLFILTSINNRQRQQLHRRTIQALEAEQENIRLKATMEGQQKERQRISQEMHDDMGSGLTALLFLSRPLAGNGNDAAGKITRIAGELIRKMNEIIWTMNHEQDSLDSLLAYLRTNMAELLEHAGIGFHFDVGDGIPDRPVSQEFRRNIYLVTKEAVHNIVRHAAADLVNISLTIDDANLVIAIDDNGKGFDPAATRPLGNGLKNMRHRMSRLDGQVDISSGNGTTVTIRAPLT